MITSSSENDIRTLERIYELNTSALTTIEAYFRMLKVVTATEVDLSDQIINSLNEWLTFIHNQCTFDLDYLEEAYSSTNNTEVLLQISQAQKTFKHYLM